MKVVAISSQAVIVTILQGFSAVIEAFTTVNDHWPDVILSAVRSDLVQEHGCELNANLLQQYGVYNVKKTAE